MPDNKEINKWLRMSSVISSLRKREATGLKTEELAGILAEGLSGIYGSARSAVFLVDEDGTNNLAEAGIKGPTRNTPYSASMPLMEHLSGSRTSLFLWDGHEDAPERSLLPETGPASVICCPVLAEDGIRGFIYLASPAERAFVTEDLRLVELAAGEISLLLEIASLLSRVGALTIRDGLTGCFNRKKFAEDIEIDIPCAERYGKPLSLLKIDIDSLKLYNDSNGRIRGDDILRKVGETLSYSIRMCDKLYRYSGEEFILILPGIDKERAVFAANRIQKVLGQLRFEGEESSQPGGKITFSIGVASFPADAVYKDGLIRTVDAALRQAREAGGDTVVSL